MNDLYFITWNLLIKFYKRENEIKKKRVGAAKGGERERERERERVANWGERERQ